MASVLATWRGMTVDERLQEFRWFDEDGLLECLSWNGKFEGELLHAQMEEETELRIEFRDGWEWHYRVPKLRRLCCYCGLQLSNEQKQEAGVQHDKEGYCQICGEGLLECCW